MILQYDVKDNKYLNVKQILKEEFLMSDRLILKLKNSQNIKLNNTVTYVGKLVNICDTLDVTIDFIEDTQSEKPEDKVVNDSLKEEINNVLHTLKPNEENVLRLRFGLNGEKPMSLKEVGDVCNLTKERIRQIEKHAILRMQHVTRARRLESYVS